MQSGQVFQMKVAASAEAVPEIRAMAEEYALAAGASERSIADLKTVVSEACTNVVRHAYDGPEPGTLEVEIDRIGDELRLLVRDHGVGIAPRPDAEHPTLHMGVPLIGALSTRFVLASERGVGTEVEVHLPLETQPRDF